MRRSSRARVASSQLGQASVEASAAAVTAVLGWGEEFLKTAIRSRSARVVLLMGASLLAMRPHSARINTAARVAQAHFKLACTVDGIAPRHRLSRCSTRGFSQLMTKPAMVGLAVGVVENGRITFLQGYGETLAGSGDPVTPETVFRWASLLEGRCGDDGRQARRAGQDQPSGAGRELCAGPQAARGQ